ncbi:hypothetical protein CRG98_004827 [Punica granatum]|uniref:Uncharacterized protein n=1 Tax=Punica granatum TaxID=22663 RepID=A0A2I0L277_PUNGR|nr:hypothetical protein CRG98_004827 [Punica granatum]
MERTRTRHQHPSPSTPASIIEHSSVRHRARPCPSPTLVISVTQHASVRHRAHQRPSSNAPVTSARHQHARAHHHTRDAPDVTRPRIRALVTARPRARPLVSKRPAPTRAPDTITARLAVHSKSSRAPNVHSSVQPSHPTLKHFPDSFLVSRG